MQLIQKAGQGLPVSPTRARMAAMTQAAPPVLQETVSLTAGFQVRIPSGELWSFPPDGRIASLGRNPAPDLCLEDLSVSREHASLRQVNGQIHVRDDGSTQGTSIDGFKLEPNKWYRWRPEARLQVGEIALQLTPPLEKAAVPVANHAGATAAAAAVGGAIGPALTLAMLEQEAVRPNLEKKEAYLKELRPARELMRQTPGIVDLPKGVPTLVIPDIHAQREYLVRALKHEIGGVPAFDLLQQGKLNLVCLGDGMHSEARGYQRWLQAEQDHLKKRPSPAMEQEMTESLGLMKMVMELKQAFPENFQYIRGNHDEMNNPGRAFFKYCDNVGESELVRHWVTNNLGADFVKEYDEFEKSMPLVVKGNGFVCSHAAPGAPLTRKEIAERDDRAFQVLSWTDNVEWEENGAKKPIFYRNLAEVGAQPDDKWLVGHRKVDEGTHRAQFDEHLIQINPRNAGDFVVALVPADGKFEPQRDIYRV